MRALLVLIVCSFLVPPVYAGADATTRSYFLYDDGSEMTSAQPTNEDPAGAGLHIESEGNVYSARTPALPEDMRIMWDDSFHLRLADRTAIDPLPDTYATRIVLTLHKEDQIVLANGQPFHLASVVATFVHPGEDVGDAEGWTDFTFEVSTTLPDEYHCTLAGCVRADADGFVIPAGMRVVLQVGLDSPSPCLFDACPLVTAYVREVRDTYRAALDEVRDLEIVDPYNPAGLSNFDPVNYTVDPPLRDFAEGDRFESIVGFAQTPRSTWRSASTTSDSRLDIRLG